MPTVTLLPDRLSDVIVTQQYAGRDPSKVHVSDCIRYILKTMDPDTYGDEAQATRFASEDTVRLEMGMAWEEVLGYGVAANVLGSGGLFVRPGPTTSKDGFITGTPDILDLGGDLPVVEEWKATWMSCRGLSDDPSAITTLPKFWKWVVQLKAYCHLSEATTGRIRALFINGDYSKGKGGTSPTFLSWQLTFTQAELIENWSMLYNAGKAVVNERERAVDEAKLNKR